MRQIWWKHTGLTLEAARAAYDPQEFTDVLTFFRIEAEERGAKSGGGGGQQSVEDVDAAFAQLPRKKRAEVAG